MEEKRRVHRIARLAGHLRRVAPIAGNSTGNSIRHALKPLMIEPRPRDPMQSIVGASLVAVPVAVTEETPRPGQTLPYRSVSILSVVSLLLIAFFVDFNFRGFAFKEHALEGGERGLCIDLVSLVVAGALVTVSRQAHRSSNAPLAIKRGRVVAFPTSKTSAVSDTLK